MSEDRKVESTVIKTPENVASVDFNDLPRTEKKARLASVLERGLTSDRLNVSLPDNLYGEWCPNDQMEIARYETMGFEIDTKYAPKRALHGSGSGEARVGDVVFMTTNRETHELIEEIRREQFEAQHGKPNSKIQREEREFKAGASAEGVKTITESVASTANYDALKQALSNNETK